MLNGYSRTLQIYGPRGTERMMNLYLNMFVGKGDQLKIKVNEVSPGKIVDEKEFQIECAEMSHDTNCLAYSFTIKEKNRLDKKKLAKLKLPQNSPLIGELVKGKTIEIDKKKIDGKKLIYTEPQRKITYIMDTRENPHTIKLAENSNALICESTYSEAEEDIAKEYAHLTSKQAAEIAKKSKSKKLFLMHLSQRYENPKQILDEAKKVFKNTIVAEDFDSAEI
jgi:ribonuclease Z